MRKNPKKSDFKNDLKDLHIPEGHKFPTTRRDFLKYGVIPFAGQILMPTFLTQLFTNTRAFAQSDGRSDPSAGYIPFLIFDMAGGGALPGNFLVGQQGGPEDLCSDYSLLGWNPRASGALDKSFGLPMARNASQLLAGMRQAASPQALANLRMGSFCHFSQDDTSSNQTSALTLIARAGLRGKFLDKGVGVINSLSGANNDVALKETQYKPLFVQSPLDIQNSISHGPAFADSSDDEILSLSRLILNLSREQIKNLSNNENLIQSAGNGYLATQAYGKTIAGLDASQDPDVAQVFQLNQRQIISLNQGGDLKSDNHVFGSIVYNVLMGNTGPGALSLGEFDYHDKGQAFADARDREMGIQIGRAVELAYRKKTKFVFALSTDGGVSSKPGERDWQADSNVRSMTVMGFYDPEKAPEQRRLQVGAYTSDGIVNQEHPLMGGGADSAPIKVAHAVLANYLSACGKLGEYEKAGGTFRNEQLDQVLIFG